MSILKFAILLDASISTFEAKIDTNPGFGSPNPLKFTLLDGRDRNLTLEENGVQLTKLPFQQCVVNSLSDALANHKVEEVKNMINEYLIGPVKELVKSLKVGEMQYRRHTLRIPGEESRILHKDFYQEDSHLTVWVPLISVKSNPLALHPYRIRTSRERWRLDGGEHEIEEMKRDLIYFTDMQVGEAIVFHANEVYHTSVRLPEQETNTRWCVSFTFTKNGT